MAKGIQLLQIEQVLEEVGRSTDGELVFVVKRRRNPQVEHTLKASRHRYAVNISMADGSTLDEGYILPS